MKTSLRQAQAIAPKRLAIGLLNAKKENLRKLKNEQELAEIRSVLLGAQLEATQIACITKRALNRLNSI